MRPASSASSTFSSSLPAGMSMRMVSPSRTTPIMPPLAASGEYRSGDLGYLLPNGDIAFLHRKDTQIMIYGKRVEVAEVESRLYQCKNVQQAVVRAFTDEDGLSYMTAYVVPANQDMRVSAVRKELLENLTSFMIPEFIVKMPQIPLNTNGKPDVSRLPVVMKAGSF